MSGETETNISGWTIDTLRASVQQQIHDLKTLLDERYQTQTKALDAAFVASEKAVTTALGSAEKAVAKAETAAERRFEAVNEFRGQLADQAATFIGRSEAEARILGLAEKLEADAVRNSVAFREINQRLDRMQGASTRGAAVYGWIIAAIGAVGVIMAILATR